MICRLYSVISHLWRLWWLSMGLLIVVTLVCGTVGFAFEEPEQGRNWLRVGYRTVGLFSLQTGDVEGEIHPTLEIARWTGAAVGLSAVAAIIGQLFSQHFRRLFVRLLADGHVVVAGLGDLGVQLVQRLRTRGYDVVVVEADSRHVGLDDCARAGAVVVIADPREPADLALARLGRAGHLLALFDDDSTNMRIAWAARELAGTFGPRRGGRLQCVIRLAQPGILEAVQPMVVGQSRQGAMRLDVVDPSELAARAMLREATLGVLRRDMRAMLIVGLGTGQRVGEALVLRAAKDWLIERSVQPKQSGQKLTIHVIEPDAGNWLGLLLARHPFLDEAAELAVHDDWLLPNTAGAALLAAYDVICVCQEDEAPAVVQATRLRRRWPRTPIVVCTVDSSSGFAPFLERLPAADGGETIVPVGLSDRILDPDMVLDPLRETLAQSAHEEYLRSIHAQLVAAREAPNESEADALLARPAVQPWTRLSEADRQATRALVERYEKYLALSVSPQSPAGLAWRHRPDAFAQGVMLPLHAWPPVELELLAEHEHNNWRAVKHSQGWTYGPQRDGERMTHPDMVDYAELSEAAKQIDRDLVGRIPVVLAKADCMIVPAGEQNDP
jgi:hypothetical protein